MLKLEPGLQSSQKGAGRHLAWGGARLINCFAEKADGDKRDEFAVIPAPGLTEWAEVGDGPYRGSTVVGGVLYVVSGPTLYSVDQYGAETSLGTIGGTGPCRVTGNYTEVTIATEATGYIYSGGSLSAPLPYDVCDVFYADGYIAWLVKDSEQFFISGLDNALSYDPLDITSVEGFPDNLVGAVNDHRELSFLGETSTEIYYNSGDNDFPFERQGNAFIEHGCFDRHSIAKLDNTFNFVAADRTVRSMVGYQPQRVSTHAIEYMLRDATYARAWTYSQEGHSFYVLECDAGTAVLDHATGTWHERASRDMTHWRAFGSVKAYGRLLFGDRVNGKLYTPSPDVYTEDGELMAIDIYPPVIEAARERASMYAYEVVCETGVGNSDAPDPQIMLRYSDNNGHTWSNEMWRSLGAVGATEQRAVWGPLGQFRNRQMHIRISDPVRRLVVSHFAEIQ